MLLCFNKPVTVKDGLEFILHTVQCLLLFFFLSEVTKHIQEQ